MERRYAERSRRGAHGGRLQERVFEEREGDGQRLRSPRNIDGTSSIHRRNPGQDTRSRSDREEPSEYSPRTTITIDWRYEICRFLQLDPDASDKEVFRELHIAWSKLKEAERVKQMPVAHQGPPRYQIIHIVSCESTREQVLYLEQPWVERAGPNRSHLRGSEQVGNVDLYLERNKDVSFLVLREYTCCRVNSHPIDRHRLGGDIDASPMTMLTAEHIDIVSHTLGSGLASLAKTALQGIPHPKFGHARNDEDDIVNDFDSNFDSDSSTSDDSYSSDREDQRVSCPYLWFYHRRQDISETTDRLEGAHQEHLNTFCEYIESRMAEEWGDVDKLVAKGQITAEYMQYIFIPGEIVLSAPKGSAKAKLQASSVTNWLRLDTQNSDGNELSLHIGDLPSLSHSFNIRELNPYPLEFSDDKSAIAEILRERGRMFWRCRARNYVCFKSFVDDGIKTPTDSRFMIDIETLQKMHPKEHRATNRDDLGTKVFSNEDPPPEHEFLMCLPPTIFGFNMQKKEWVSLDVDLIQDVVWNSDAFDFLVIEKQTRELVKAVITHQIQAAESTDLIHGKGSGLTMLLHGGPGTGKTLTAESVAEVAKKPLYRVTCGDIGTKAEEVEKYLETIFLLGKTWDCVVLLDEADVFLEERSTVNLDRNALVSVFLRMLEYYDGILILTSNRVGIFDEAFKSRIQLNLRYQNLDRNQRSQIWKNFISRLERLADDTGGFEIDAEDIRSHIDELATPQLNGREIRNAISTARQLASYRGQALGYSHLVTVIAEAEKFDQYLKDLHEGFTEDERQNDKGTR